LLLIETKTKRHMSADSGSGSPPTLERFLRKGSKDGIDLLRSARGHPKIVVRQRLL